MSDSVRLRRQIGFFKKQIQRSCADVTQALKDYNISLPAPQFEALNDDELETFRLEVTSIRSNLLKPYTRITKLDEEWANLQKENSDEQQVFDDYLRKYGDYRITIVDAVKNLENLDSLLNTVDQEYAKRHLTLSSVSSEPHTPDEEGGWNRENRPLLPNAPQIPIIPRTTDPSLMNFVDASILSKLELPTFDGNLLDFPEFSSRFATLVGDKVQLDDTTKFSLLKSCLRGKALHVIQGLSMTPGNYKIAMDILRTHFDDKVTLKHILYTKLASLPACDPEGRNLLLLYNQMFSLVRQFSNGTDDSKEKALGALLLNKLPARVKSQIYDQTQHDHNVSPLELLHLLTNIVRKESTLSEMEYYSRSSSNLHFQQGSYIATKQPKDQASPNSANANQRLHCPFCDSRNHTATSCTTYTTAKQRSEQAKRRKLCYNCLSPRHSTKKCPSKFHCRLCSRRHHTSLCFSSRSKSPATNTSKSTTLHPPSRPLQPRHPTPPRSNNHAVHFDNIIQTSCTDEETKETEAAPACSEQNSQDITLTSSQINSPAPLMCTEVWIFNPDNPFRSLKTTAFLDCGSTTTYITNDLAALLDLPLIKTETLDIATFGEPIQIESSTFRLGIKTENGDRCFTVKSSPSLPNDVMQVTPGYQPSVTTCSPSLLIGNDYFWDLVLSHNFYYKSLAEGYRLLHTSIGDIILKKAIDTRMKECNLVSIDNNNEDPANPANHNDLCELVSRFWKLESIGILDNPDQSDDEECLKQFNETIYYDSAEKRYVVTLPFKTDPTTIPDNHALAFSRLCNQLRTLQENPIYLKKYHAVIEDQLQRNIIEQVPLEEIHRPCHYLSHHGVLKKDDKDLKIRCVYDGSAKMKGQISLNETLYRGPVLLPDLVGILLRARLCKILISSDIEKAFLMVGLNHNSRDYTRFLWLKDPHMPPSPQNLITYRFTRVPFGLVCSPFLLAGTIHFHLSSTATDLSRHIIRNTYVDNVFYGATNTDEGISFYNKSKELFQKAGMNLRAFASNEEKLNEYFGKREIEAIPKLQNLLGLKWDLNTDELVIPLPDKPPTKRLWTKRKVLKHIASFYDPLGFFTPSLLAGKVFLQSLWKEKLLWDDALPIEKKRQWENILSSWTPQEISIPRLIVDFQKETPYEYDLHVFADASSAAYCATSYLVQRIKNQTVRTSLLMSKCRLAPLNSSMTIPRLEIAALMIGSKLLTYLIKELDLHISRKFLWTDSTVALYWTKNNRNLPIFVKNRVKIILDNTSDVTILHVPTEMNPADLGTRGCAIEELIKEELWWFGPSFLREEQGKWPEHARNILQENSENIQEIDALEKHLTVANFSQTPKKKKTPVGPEVNSLLDLKRFSTWTKILRTMMFILKFLTKESKRAAYLFGSTKVVLLERSETILFRLAQSSYPPSSDAKKQYRLLTCEKTLLWKSHGRIEHANLPSSAITPIFLPRESRIATLYILHVHEKNNHCGVNHTLTLLRQRVWIPKGRATVKRVIHNECFHCKRFRSKPFTLPPFPAHPERRVTPPQYPFENVGMDFFGPLTCRTTERTDAKYWMLLLTCLNCRAVYVDVILDMTTATVLHVLRRFIATIGCPRWILCDNAQTFKTINQCYSSLPVPDIDDDIIDYCANHRIQMKFIPSLSPWQGGVYEKMVDIFKKSYRHAIANRRLDIEEIRTLAKEAEAIVNTRPLTYYSDEISFQPLRPIDFLHPYARLCSLYPTESRDQWSPSQTTRDSLLEDWNRTSDLVSTFWTRWSTEYLTTMREQYKAEPTAPRSHTKGSPKYGDVVLIQDSTLDRGQWNMGRVIGSQDEYQRSSQIQLPSLRIITRPNSLIYKLEIPVDDEPQTSRRTKTSSRDEPPPSRHPMITRSRARAHVNTAMLLCLFAVFGIASSSAPRCPEELNSPKTILYATNCKSHGIAVARYKGRFCYYPVTCPIGHIRFENPYTSLNPDTSLCAKECSCPDWTSSCSFHTGPITAKSRKQALPHHLLHYQPNFVCSFQRNENCSSIKRVGTFNQVQLFDDTLLLVENLRVTLKDYLTKNDFLCIDRNGVKRPANNDSTGTSQFCKKHKCRKRAKLFCLYDNPIAFLLINDSEHDAIPLKAWGPTTKTYYGFPSTFTTPNIPFTSTSPVSPTTQSAESAHPADTSASSASCSKGGLTLNESNDKRAVEACIDQYCVFKRDKDSSHIPFPNSLTMYDYKVTIKIWSGEKLVKELQLFCPAQPICETMHCIFCWERLYNTQCWTFLQVVVIILCALIPPLWIYVTIRILCCLLRLMRIILCRICCLDKVFRIICRRRRLPTYTNRRRRHKRSIFPYLALTCLQISRSLGCSQITSISAREDTCIEREGKQTCTFNEATVIALQPLHQESCLTLKTHRNIPIGLLSIKVKGISFQCHKDVQFYTRDHQILSESIHRCYLAGSCTEHACENTTPTTKLQEISRLANESPGYTFCTSSCGCVTCDGCFMCQPSCLFYRIYAQPMSRRIYEVFTCPSWETVVSAEITLKQRSGSSSTTLTFRPGRTIRWKNIKFNLIGATTPQLPILSSFFMATKGRTSIIQPSYSGQLTPKSAGQLQCSSFRKAKSFKCVFSTRACSCSAAVKTASCVCSSGNMAKFMEGSPLPLISKNYFIFVEGKNLYAKTRIGSILQLHVVAEDMKIVTQQTNASYETTASDAEGCYNCKTGAEITFLCKSSSKNTLANIVCSEEQNQIAYCTNTGHANKLRFHFNTSTVHTNCKITCPANVQEIKIQGNLQYIEDESIIEDTLTRSITGNISRDMSYLKTISKRLLNPMQILFDFFNSPIEFILLSSALFVLVFIMFHFYVSYPRTSYRFRYKRY